MSDEQAEDEVDAAESQPDPDESDEIKSPMVVLDSGEGRVVDGSALQSAFDCLEIRVPIDELREFGEKRIQTLVRLNETEKAGLVQAALEEGIRAIRQVMGGRVGEEAR